MNQRAIAFSISDRPRYIGPLCPVVFPEEAEVPETQLHLELRTLLYQLLSDHLGLESTVGSDQFVYFDAADPKRCVAPDVYVQLKPRGELVRSWKTWERGAPDVAVEILSESDAPEVEWEKKLRAYHSLGVQELVMFDAEISDPPLLRIWDRVNDALMERVISPTSAASSVLDLQWVVAPAEGHACSLRIADREGNLIPTRTEARKVEAEARKVEAEARKAEAEARQAAEARIRELEAQIRRLESDKAK